MRPPRHPNLGDGRVEVGVTGRGHSRDLAALSLPGPSLCTQADFQAVGGSEPRKAKS